LLKVGHNVDVLSVNFVDNLLLLCIKLCSYFVSLITIRYCLFCENCGVYFVPDRRHYTS